MGKKELQEVLSEAKPRIAAFWTSCRDSGLEGHGPELTGKVDQALAGYVDALGAFPGKPGKDAILGIMKDLFEQLDELNDEADGALLETDERELLVPVIIEAAVAAGLELKEFPDGDPTGEFRNF